MLPASVPYLNDLLGRYYRFYHPSQGPRPTSRPMWFGDSFYAHQFLVGLDCDPDFWLQLLVSLGEQRPSADPRRACRQVADWIAEGRVHIYPSANPALLNSLGGLTRFTKNRDSAWSLMPAANTASGAKPARGFSSLNDAKTFVQSLNPSPQQLKATGKLLPAGQWQAQAPIQSISQALHQGELVVVEEPIRHGAGRPMESNNLAEELLEAATTGLPPTLGPHADEGGDGAHNDEPVDETPVCELQKFMLRCSHYGSRGYMLDVLNGEPNMNGSQKVLQVITQNDRPDKITIDFTGACGHGKNACPSINLRGPDGDSVIKQSGKEITVLPPGDDQPVETFRDFLRHYLLPGDIDFNTYRFSSTGCSEIEQVEGVVHAFPTWKWGGKISMGYGYASADDNEAKPGETASWKLEGDISGNVSTHKWSIGQSSNRNARDYFSELHDTLNSVVERLESFKSKGEHEDALVKCSISWPKVMLGGNLELQEVEQKNEVGFGGEVYLDMSPLLAVDVKTDILEWLINYSQPAYGKLINKIKRKAAEGVGTEKIKGKAVVAVDLSVDGKLEGKLSWKKSAGKGWGITEGASARGRAGITVGLKARVEAEASIFYVKLTIGMALSMKSTDDESVGIGGIFELFACERDGSPAIDGSITFTGAAIYYTYYAQISAESTSSDVKELKSTRRARGGSQEQSDDSEVNYKEHKMEKLVDLLPKAQFPKAKSRYSLNEVEL